LSAEVSAVPRRRRVRQERTHNWEEIQQQTLWPEQEAYERLRPVVLFGETAASRAKETGVSERTLRYQADQFEQYGMASLFPKERAPTPETGRTLPPEMRQLIVDLKAEHSGFRPHELARICFLHFGRKPSDHTIQRILADGPSFAIDLQLITSLSHQVTAEIRPVDMQFL
jgi:putative transposase